MPDALTLQDLLVPIAFVLLGVVAGLVLERVVLRWLDRFAERTDWRADNVVVAALKGVPLFWGAAAGIYFATLAADAGSRFVETEERLLSVAVLWSVIVVVARALAGGVASYAGREGTLLPRTSLIPTLVRIGVYVVGVLLVLNELGISVTPLLTALGVGGLAVALALQDTLQNVFAGVYLIASRQLRPGDYVRLEGDDETEVEGTIADIHWRSTTLRTLLDNTVIVPNARMASAVVTNFALPERPVWVRVAGAVDYAEDPARVETLTLEVAEAVVREVFGAPADQPARLYFHTMGEFSLNFTVLVRAPRAMEQFELRHRFLKALLARYRAEGVRFPFPIREFEMELANEGFRSPRSPGVGPSSAAAPFSAPGPVGRTEGPERLPDS